MLIELTSSISLKGRHRIAGGFNHRKEIHNDSKS